MARKRIRLNVPVNGGLPERREPQMGDLAVIAGKGYEVEAFDGKYVYTRIGQFRYTHPSLEGFISQTASTEAETVDEIEKGEEDHEQVQDQ